LLEKHDWADKGKPADQTKLGLAGSGTSIKASLPSYPNSKLGRSHACARFCCLSTTSTFKKFLNNMDHFSLIVTNL